MKAGCCIQLGCGGDYVAQFGGDLVFGNSLADIKGKIRGRWNKSIGKSYQISFVDERGNGVVETYVPKLVKVRSLTAKVENVVGQLSFDF
jgi:hypothetical protein